MHAFTVIAHRFKHSHSIISCAYARPFSSKFCKLMLSRFPPVNRLRKSQTSTGMHSGRLEPITSTTVERRNLPTTHIVDADTARNGFRRRPAPPVPKRKPVRGHDEGFSHHYTRARHYVKDTVLTREHANGTAAAACGATVQQ